MIVEHAGMQDVPAYMAGVRHKERVYRANGMRAMFVYPGEVRGPRWPEGMVGRNDEAGQRSGDAVR
jgi:4'-phosphopantetheinyl transferase EntD